MPSRSMDRPLAKLFSAPALDGSDPLGIMRGFRSLAAVVLRVNTKSCVSDSNLARLFMKIDRLPIAGEKIGILCLWGIGFGRVV